VYIITAWDKVSETHVRAPDNATAVRHAREFVNQGKRIRFQTAMIAVMLRAISL
jgi:hypothetical protein